jgi:hypothetical protein
MLADGGLSPISRHVNGASDRCSDSHWKLLGRHLCVHEYFGQLQC